jgi:hypothetical protein
MRQADNALTYGFRIVGGCQNERRLVDWPAAFSAYCLCEGRAEVHREAYLSAFCFGTAFRDQLASTGSPRGYAGECWSRWLWFDIDRDELHDATAAGRKLVAGLQNRYALDADELLVFFSGKKGLHIGLPLAICGWPPPSPAFNHVCRRLAETLADLAGVRVDASVYDAVRPFRAPNSRHPRTGLYKRRVAVDELMLLNAGRLAELASEPEPFDLPPSPNCNRQAVDDWSAAALAIQQQAAVATQRAVDGRATLNRATLEFIREGATTGDRHRLTFSAAANLAEFGCSFELAYALLSEAALDSGLSPADVRRQIQCGLKHTPK